ncbi:MAG: alpha/beta hydrolase [Planctomycetota bacterium]
MISRFRASLLPWTLLLCACGGAGDDGTTDAATTTDATDATTADATASTSDATATTSDATTAGPTATDPSTTAPATDTDETDTDPTTGEPLGCQGGVVGVTCEDRYENVDFGWQQVERWHDPHPAIPQMEFPPDGRGDVGGQRLVFFDNLVHPPSGSFLLYYGPGWNQGDATPVLLVHGANDSPDRAWANPNESGAYGCGDEVCPDTGLLQALVGAGHRVFAIGFGHRQGDNLTAARLVHDALRVVQDRTGADKVDVIGWSMGAFSARLYASGLARDQPYADDIRRLLLIGGPNLGFDYLFRYGINHDLFIFPECTDPLMVAPINAPAPHTATTCFGVLYDHPELSVFETQAGDFYPGQKQMLARWDDVYAIPELNQDWYTTYHGGKGFVSSGLGIDVAINQGSLVAGMIEAGIPASVSTYLLCGDTQDKQENAIPVIPNETSGPSDGVVFIDSCAAPDGVGTLADEALIARNHLELGWHPDAVAVLLGWLL